MVKNKKRIFVLATLLFEVIGICFAQGEDLFKDSNRASTNVQNAQFPMITPDLRVIRRQCVAIAGNPEYKCIPLSLKINRFLGIHPRRGDPFFGRSSRCIAWLSGWHCPVLESAGK